MPIPLDHSPLPGRLPQKTAELSDLATIDPRGDPEAVTPYNYQPYYGEGRFAPNGYNPYFDNSPSPRGTTSSSKGKTSKVEVLPPPRQTKQLPSSKPAGYDQTIDVPFKVVPDPKAVDDKAYKRQIQDELDKYNLQKIKAEQFRQDRERYAETKRVRQKRDDDHLEDLNAKRKYYPPTNPPKLKTPYQPSNHPATPTAQRQPSSYADTPTDQHQLFTPKPYPKQQPLPYAEPAEFRQKVPWSVVPPGGEIVRPPTAGALAPIPKAPNFPIRPFPNPLPSPNPLKPPQMPAPNPMPRPPIPPGMPSLRPPSMRPPGSGVGRPSGDSAMDPFFGTPPYASPLLPPGDPGSVMNPNIGNAIDQILHKFFGVNPKNQPPIKPNPSFSPLGSPVYFPVPKTKRLADYDITIFYDVMSWSAWAGYRTSPSRLPTGFTAYEILSCWVEFERRTDSRIYTESGTVVVRMKATKNSPPRNVKFGGFLTKNPGFGSNQGGGSSYIIEKVQRVDIRVAKFLDKKEPASPLYPFPLPDGLPDAIPYFFPEPDPLPAPPKPFPINKPAPPGQPKPSPQPKPIGYPQPKPVPAPQPKPVPAPQPQPVPTPENQPIPDVYPFPSPNPEPNLDPNPEAKPKPQPLPKIVGFPYPNPMPQTPPKIVPKPDPKPYPQPQPNLYYPPPPPCPIPNFDMPCRFQDKPPKPIAVRIFDRCYTVANISIAAHRAIQISVIPGTEQQITELFERVFQLEALQCQGGIFEEDNMIDLSIPVVVCQETPTGRKKSKTTQSTIRVRASQSAAIAAQFASLAAIQSDLCKAGTEPPELVKRIYTILGGDGWNFDREGVPNRNEKFDAEFKEISASAFVKGEGGKYDEQQQESESLLTWLKRCFGSTYFRTGIHNLPTQVQPTMLTYSDGEPPIEVSTLADYLAWFIRQFDLLLGQFPVEIEIEDADPLKKGKQTKTIELANLSESIGELYGLATIGATNADLAINFLVRLAAEVVSTKSATLITQDYAKANASFLGYEGKAVEREIEFAFNPLNAEKIEGFEEFLANSKAKIVGWEETDKASMVDYMHKLMFSASIIKAAFFRNSKQLSLIEKEIESLFAEGKDDTAWQDFLALINDPVSPFNSGVDAGEYPLSNIDSKPVPPTDSEQQKKQKKP